MAKWRFARTMIAMVAATCLGAMAQAPVAQEEAIKIAVEGKFPPFNYLDANGDLQGFDVEIAKALCGAMKASCKLVVQDWNTMIPDLLASKYDAIISSMSMSAERREQVAFTSRYYDSPSVFLTAKTSPQQTFTPADLAGEKLGVTLSTAQEAYAEKFYADASITVFDASPELYEGLAEGQVDVILEDKLAAYDWLTNTKAGQCCEFRGEDIKDPVYIGGGAGIALRKQDEDLLQKFEAALATITEDGTYNMINAKYFPFSIR